MHLVARVIRVWSLIIFGIHAFVGYSRLVFNRFFGVSFGGIARLLYTNRYAWCCYHDYNLVIAFGISGGGIVRLKYAKGEIRIGL